MQLVCSLRLSQSVPSILSGRCHRGVSLAELSGFIPPDDAHLQLLPTRRPWL